MSRDFQKREARKRIPPVKGNREKRWDEKIRPEDAGNEGDEKKGIDY